MSKSDAFDAQRSKQMNTKERADTELARSIMRKKLENQERQVLSMSPSTMLNH